MTLRYRPEIDGLRALAVLPVMAFHAGFVGFSGGFVGVDVFFVISGYLITGILVGDLEADRFSILKFYDRRARRILPALFVMLAASAAMAHFALIPPLFANFSASVFAVVLFLSNFLFISEVDYFGPAAEETPLLHTWSLAVEEQFYILFPILLWLLWKLWRRPALIWGVALITVASLIFSEWAWRHYPAQTFYFLPSRAWELGAGALCALVPIHAPKSPNLIRQAPGMLGILAIAGSVYAFDQTTPFPSLWAAIPVGGSVAVILWATPGTMAARLLSLRAVVAIGLISYSAYLWHNPLFAFARLSVVGEPGVPMMLALFAISLALAALSWRYVEGPFRVSPGHPSITPKRWQVFTASLAGIAVFVACGLWGFLSDGRAALWQRSASSEALQTYHLVQTARDGRRRSDNGACRFNVEALTPDIEARVIACAQQFGPGVAVLGDSHAIDLAEALLLASPSQFLFGLTKGGCRPDSATLPCSYSAFATLITEHPALFERVVFEIAGQHLLSGPHGRVAEALFRYYAPDDEMIAEEISVQHERIEHIAAYLATLTPNLPVFWLTPRIEHHLDDSYVMSRSCDYPFALRPGQALLFDRLAEAVADQTQGAEFTVINQTTAAAITFPQDFMTCEAMHWRDGDHLSHSGLVWLGERLAPIFMPDGAAVSD